jgi:phosphate transport system permease protein
MSAAAGAVSVPRFEPQLMRRKVRGSIFYGACLLAISLVLLTLIVLLLDVLRKGLPWLDLQFLTGVPSRKPAEAGLFPAFVGSLYISVIVAAVTFPLGIAAAIYLQEYQGSSWLNRFLRRNISNLAGVPSIIYGIFGLGLFVRTLGLGYTLIAGAMTLVLVILPVVIIAAMEALRAVPDSQREAAYAMGATRWQMVRRSVLPAAAPGILTGIILSMSRAVGETAPLILVGAVTFVTYTPRVLEGGYTVLPIQVYQWATRPQDDFQGISAAAIITILALMFVLNATAVVVRIRLSRHLQW